MKPLKSTRKFDAALRNPFICYLDFGGGDSAPAPDPAIGEAAKQNSEVAREALAFNRQVYEEGKPRQAEMERIAKQYIIDQTARQAKIDEISGRVVNDQLSTSAQNQAQAQDQWARFKTLFAPVEEQMVRDATSIDTPAEQERAAGEAGAQVAKSYDATQKQTARSLASMGINPNSVRALAANEAVGMAKAADSANAMTSMRQMVKDKGITLRAGAANFGRNMPNTAASAYGLTLNAGNNAAGNNNAAATLANNGAMNSSSLWGNAGSNANASLSGMNQGFGTAIQGNNSAGSMLNQQYGNQINAWGQKQQADAQSSAGFGSMLGQLGAAWFLMSSKKIKENKKPINDSDTLEKIKDLPVESWKYKKGISDEGEHVGAYAEDVQAKFGDKAAPGGKAIDMISMHGITLSAIKGLAKSVDKLENKVAKIAAGGIKRRA